MRKDDELIPSLHGLGILAQVQAQAHLLSSERQYCANCARSQLSQCIVEPRQTGQLKAFVSSCQNGMALAPDVELIAIHKADFEKMSEQT